MLVSLRRGQVWLWEALLVWDSGHTGATAADGGHEDSPSAEADLQQGWWSIQLSNYF